MLSSLNFGWKFAHLNIVSIHPHFLIADDEQSDFFHESGGSVAGIPHVVPWWEKDQQDIEEEKFYRILNGALPLINKGAQRSKIDILV